MSIRHMVAIVISAVIHITLLWSSNEHKAYAMPIGSSEASTTVNVQFVSPAEPKKAVKKSSTKETTTKKAITKKEVTKKPIKKNAIAKKVTTPQKQAEKRAEEKKEAVAKAQPSPAGVTHKPTLVKKPQFLKKPISPNYPRLAQRKGIEGTALYEIWLDEYGKQIKRQLVHSSGTNMLDQAALEAIKEWEFSPQVVSGQAIAHRVHIPVRFTLN